MSYFQEGTASDGIFSLLGKGDKQNQELPCSGKGITKSYQAKKWCQKELPNYEKDVSNSSDK